MPKANNPSKTLAKILSIIGADVTKIKRVAKDQQLEPQDALTLTRYAQCLDDIARSKEKDEEKAKKELAKLPTEELVKTYLETNKPKDKK